MEMCCAHVEEMDELIEAILKHARCLEDKLPAYGTQMYSLGTRSLSHQSLDLGIKVLEELGEPFPRRLNLPNLYRECYAVKRLLRCGPWHPGGIDLVPECSHHSSESSSLTSLKSS